MPQAIDHARSLFKNLPDEIFDDWMVERVETAGWPPVGARWNALLGGYSAEEWAMLSWSKKSLDLSALVFSEGTKIVLRGLSDARFRGARNAYSEVENSDDRMRSIHSHVKTTGLLPGAVILIERPECVWELIDGCHRLSTYWAWISSSEWSEKIQRVQSAWVGRLA